MYLFGPAFRGSQKRASKRSTDCATGTGRRVFALLNGIDADRIGEPECLRRHPVQAQCGRRIFNRLPWREVEMTAATKVLSQSLRPLVAAVCLGAASAFLSAPAFARGPEGIADVAEKVIDSVVNISTSQTVEAKNEGRGAVPQLPPGSPFEEFFDDFFKNRRGKGKGGDLQPRKTNSLGSGFIIDPAGI